MIYLSEALAQGKAQINPAAVLSWQEVNLDFTTRNTLQPDFSTGREQESVSLFPSAYIHIYIMCVLSYVIS